MSHLILSDQREMWRRKPVLRQIYIDFYKRILKHVGMGLTLEIGGGSGNLKEFLPEAISTDLVPSPWLDAALDAQHLPFRTAAIRSIVMVDVLHHIESPIRFLREASRVLEPGGKLLMIEPAITPVSTLFYRRFHPEPVRMDADPLHDPVPNPDRAPFDANQAIPSLLFEKYRQRFEEEFPEFRIEERQWFSLFAYPLSGGFRNWSLVPLWAVRPLIAFENCIGQKLARFFGFRIFVVLEKKSNDYELALGKGECGRA